MLDKKLNLSIKHSRNSIVLAGGGGGGGLLRTRRCVNQQNSVASHVHTVVENFSYIIQENVQAVRAKTYFASM